MLLKIKSASPASDTSTAGAGAMGVGGSSDVKLDLPMGSSKPDAPEYRKKNKTNLIKLKAVIK